jgi:hypothetical protein
LRSPAAKRKGRRRGGDLMIGERKDTENGRVRVVTLGGSGMLGHNLCQVIAVRLDRRRIHLQI